MVLTDNVHSVFAELQGLYRPFRRRKEKISFSLCLCLLNQYLYRVISLKASVYGYFSLCIRLWLCFTTLQYSFPFR